MLEHYTWVMHNDASPAHVTTQANTDKNTGNNNLTCCAQLVMLSGATSAHSVVAGLAAGEAAAGEAV